MFIIALSTDFLDGYIARKYNMIITSGKLLEPIADKLVAVAGVLLCVYSCFNYLIKNKQLFSEK